MHAEFAEAEVDDRHVLHDPPADSGVAVALIVQRQATGSLRT